MGNSNQNSIEGIPKYHIFLKPIKDSLDWWDIDITTELEDYLNDLSILDNTLGQHETQLNFIEAAFILQGSSQIYCKKVEILHSLVYHTLATFHLQKIKAKDELDAVKIKKIKSTSSKDNVAWNNEEKILNMYGIHEKEKNIDIDEDISCTYMKSSRHMDSFPYVSI